SYSFSTPSLLCSFSSSYPISFFFLIRRPPPRSPLFPYTTLFRSGVASRALEQFLADAGPRFGLKRVGAFAYADNPASVRVLEKKDRKSTRLNSSHVSISYAVFCLKKKTADVGEGGSVCTAST